MSVNESIMQAPLNGKMKYMTPLFPEKGSASRSRNTQRTSWKRTELLWQNNMMSPSLFYIPFALGHVTKSLKSTYYGYQPKIERTLPSSSRLDPMSSTSSAHCIHTCTTKRVTFNAFTQSIARIILIPSSPPKIRDRSRWNFPDTLFRRARSICIYH